ncbi:hypothetical protein BN1058_01113 [Paraliobacillus sp. PM-2]|uniref:hypothetical protein n=1 Tax=Paraliobacillus sp. PM-2 TaxID=1462524 RepID=UPI00061C2F2A|nr:hypothetical protein [Paraliobacillus sp. PM-2]CQR46837.1 hypothetical protein BN1058_01113 [Paraliobacillus sp. PM-2]
MPKQYHLIKRMTGERGFLFPYVSFLAMLLLLATTTSITLYKNNQQLTFYQMEQIELESLRQMTVAAIKNELGNEQLALPFSSTKHTFPNGEAIIQYQSHNDTTLNVTIITITKKQSEKLWSTAIPLY